MWAFQRLLGLSYDIQLSILRVWHNSVELAEYLFVKLHNLRQIPIDR